MSTTEFLLKWFNFDMTISEYFQIDTWNLPKSKSRWIKSIIIDKELLSKIRFSDLKLNFNEIFFLNRIV